MSLMTFEELERAWADTPPLPRDRGAISLLVVRTAPGQHATPPRIELTRELGVVGDRWSHRDNHLDAQVTVMMTHVAALIGPGQPLETAGDNLLVDLDLGDDNLPIGSHLRVGSALLEISPKPHSGCKTFSSRFGQDALRWVNWHTHRGRRLRGIHCRVIESGFVAAGDEILVAHRAAYPAG